MAVAGAGLTAWYGILTAHFQLTAAPTFRSRCMAIWSTALNGSRPVGGPIVGSAAEVFGARAGLLVGGVGLLAVIIPAWGLITGNGVVRSLLGRSGRDGGRGQAPATVSV